MGLSMLTIGFAYASCCAVSGSSSGAGKTTLLDVMAQRKNSGVVKGQITINGHPLEPASFRRIAVGGFALCC